MRSDVAFKIPDSVGQPTVIVGVAGMGWFSQSAPDLSPALFTTLFLSHCLSPFRGAKPPRPNLTMRYCYGRLCTVKTPSHSFPTEAPSSSPSFILRVNIKGL